jgi:ribosomal RNA-processing protein 36
MTRTDKHQPQEVSSKQPVSVIRQVVEPLRRRALDPRFDRSFGKFNSDLFKKSYTFLQDLSHNEMDELKTALKKERNGAKREQLKDVLRRRENREREHQRLEHERRALKNVRKDDLDKVAQGVKNPFYLKRNQQRQVVRDLHEQELHSKSDKAQARVLQKRAKHHAAKQKRKLPWQSHAADE